MKPVVPPVGHEGSRFFEIGLGQSQYDILPGYVDGAGLVMSEWELEPEERAALLAGGRIRLWTSTFNVPLQPVQLEVVS